ncbi:hypothetical protein [Azonexus hydrophilus]|uniref:hypothetical protein n=1 Tax=Azonexus hydrophilus TaxID=418702 RepID=UPI0019657B9C|nr:hypothetical protein [Azonexus hydrophilus]
MARLGIQSERIKHLVDTQVLPLLLAAGNVAALTNLLNAEFPLATDSCRRAWDHSHSIVNEEVKSVATQGFRWCLYDTFNPSYTVKLSGPKRRLVSCPTEACIVLCIVPHAQGSPGGTQTVKSPRLRQYGDGNERPPDGIGLA